jgi:hypothetical protein
MNENDNIMTPVEQLTQIVCQILDDNAGRIFNVNLHSTAGRQIIGELVASQLIDSPGMVVVDPTQATDEQRQMVDAIMMQDLAEGERN